MLRSGNLGFCTAKTAAEQVEVGSGLPQPLTHLVQDSLPSRTAQAQRHRWSHAHLERFRRSRGSAIVRFGEGHFAVEMESASHPEQVMEGKILPSRW